MTMVLKFGGTSVSDSDRILTAARRALALQGENQQVVVVVSAQGKTTDRLIAHAQPLLCDDCRREMDAYLAAGEQMSAALMAMAIRKLGGKAVSLGAWQMELMSEETHGDARLTGVLGSRIQRELDKGNIVVAAGFQGLTPSGDLTTLGRGGSDTTAVALAAFLKADQCRIYTDVDGVYDRDRRQFPEAKRFDTIDYDAMLALARQGARVLHDRCVELAKQYAVPVRVLSSFRDGEGTLVGSFPEPSSPIPAEDIPVSV